MITESIRYRDGDVECHGTLTRPESDAPVPVVLVSHAWAGQKDFERAKAARLAELGWAGFALDNYGEGRTGDDPQTNNAMMMPFLDDRALLRRRLLAGLEAARGCQGIDGSKVGAIGFCFGGLCVLDLARSGADVRGVVSFHGLFQPTGLPAESIRARVLALHGYDDPMAKPDQVLALAAELGEAGADWQIHAYGGTMHAFTNPQANDPSFGTVYSPKADARSWASMVAFLAECFAD